jgi:expansin
MNWFAVSLLAACAWTWDGSSPTPSCPPHEVHEGGASFYDFADGSGACSFPAAPGDLHVAAINDVDYAASAACGRCAKVTGPTGTVVVQIVDRCPGCGPGGLDLHPEAFAKLAPLSDGRIEVRWSYVPCEVTGPLAYHFEDGSSAVWTSVQVRNHRTGIATFEVRGVDGYREVQRASHNYFVDPDGMGDGPLTFRVTDVHGSVLEQDGIARLDDAEAVGTSQLPSCH